MMMERHKTAPPLHDKNDGDADDGEAHPASHDDNDDGGAAAADDADDCEAQDSPLPSR